MQKHINMTQGTIPMDSVRAYMTCKPSVGARSCDVVSIVEHLEHLRKPLSSQGSFFARARSLGGSNPQRSIGGSLIYWPRPSPRETYPLFDRKFALQKCSHQKTTA
ncbi:MAG: hypothetical protein NXH90_17205 [Flavobacteriaceae bacterium]|nr:hypothetical protein [Flavobacteriaceae bacterium]